MIVRAILELLRPANVTTALADVLAGFGVAGLGNRPALPWLLLSTACLYAGGVVLNDVFDREVDRIERPERPLPSGRVPVALAAALGTALLLAGILAATQTTTLAAAIAASIATCVVLYDAWGKHHLFIAPVNMGLCRALNLLLGIAAVPDVVWRAWPLALIPLCYIGGITALSRGEVHGGSRRIASFALISLVAAVIALFAVAMSSGDRSIPALVLASALAWRVLPAFWQARRAPHAGTIRTAVKRGVLALVLVDATIGAAYAGPTYAAVILATAVVAGLLARWFAVT